MLATWGQLPAGPQWRYEVQWAGLRVIAEITGGRLRFTSASGRDVTAHFPEFAALGNRLRDGLLDGQLVVLQDGVPCARAAVERLRVREPRRLRRMATRPDRPSAFMVFDVLRLYGVPLLHRRFEERRSTLERLRLDEADDRRRVALSPVYDDGEALLVAARQQGLPGVVAKRADSPYRPGVRDPSWVQTVPGTGITGVTADDPAG